MLGHYLSTSDFIYVLSALVIDTIAVMKHQDQEIFRSQGFIQLILPHHSSILKYDRTGTQDRDQEAIADAEGMEECYLLT
jgi:hypothetical protein